MPTTKCNLVAPSGTASGSRSLEWWWGAAAATWLCGWPKFGYGLAWSSASAANKIPELHRVLVVWGAACLGLVGPGTDSGLVAGCFRKQLVQQQGQCPVRVNGVRGVSYWVHTVRVVPAGTSKSLWNSAAVSGRVTVQHTLGLCLDAVSSGLVATLFTGVGCLLPCGCGLVQPGLTDVCRMS